MKKSMRFYSASNYSRALERLQNNLRTGRFATYTQQKQQQIWKCLCRYARQLGITVKAPVVTACLAAGLCLATPSEAQVTFAVQTGGANPLDGIVVNRYSKPAFVDIDGDGDQDVFIGSYQSGIQYYENTGDSHAPVFVLRSGTNNPLNTVAFERAYAPAFADIDGDGDKDVFIGTYNGPIFYYQNTGDSHTPVFTQQTGAANPFNGVSIGAYSTPAFADIDGDGDLDAFVGDLGGGVYYFKNNASPLPSTPVFVAQTGTNNPLNGVSTRYYGAPSFTDVDKNGTIDAFIGTVDGNILYYKNTGSAVAPVFTAQTGAANPLNSVAVGIASAPAVVDIDGNTAVDVFIGNATGATAYYKNTSAVLPLQLLGFSGSNNAGYNLLQWQTAAEMNTQQFELERGTDGTYFTKIATVHASGSGNNNYSYRDNTAGSSKQYYRLKMIDIDGRFTYSYIISVSGAQAGRLSIYPNPATDVIILQTAVALSKTNAAVYDAHGRLLKNVLITSTQQQVNVKAFAAGVYSIKFADRTTLRFVKE